jgi:hypothetical protein
MHKRLRWSQASKDTQDLNTRLGRRQREIVSMFAEVHLPSLFQSSSAIRQSSHQPSPLRVVSLGQKICHQKLD